MVPKIFLKSLYKITCIKQKQSNAETERGIKLRKVTPFITKVSAIIICLYSFLKVVYH
jgi:hypothetical protein